MRQWKRRWVLAGLVLTLTAVGAFVAYPVALSRVTRGNRDRIRPGMVREDVVLILGQPGDHRTGPTTGTTGITAADLPRICQSATNSFGGASHAKTEAWMGDELFVIVTFARSSDDVLNCAWFDAARDEPSLVGDLTWRAKRQWRSWFPEKAEARP